MKHCGFCGGLINQAVGGWPRPCLTCGKLTYNSPKPVVVLAVRGSRGGFLFIKRGIAPGIGEWAFPGGYVDYHEDWRAAAVREAKEELGITLGPSHMGLRHVVTSDSNHLVLCVHYENWMDDPDEWKAHDLTSTLNDTGEQEILAIEERVESPTDLAFSSHQAFADSLEFFGE